MATIGTFTREGDGFVGTITTMALKAKAAFKPAEKTADKAPDYRIYAGGVEIGAAWSATSKAGNPYLSVRLDDPSFASAIFCRLVELRDGYTLVWSR